jgi:hypothetical protein
VSQSSVQADRQAGMHARLCLSVAARCSASQGTAITADTEGGCVYAAHSDRGHPGSPASVFQSCTGGDEWALLGGFGGGSNSSVPGLNGLSISGRISHIAIDFSSPVHSRRLVIGAEVLGAGGQVWIFEPGVREAPAPPRPTDNLPSLN